MEQMILDNGTVASVVHLSVRTVQREEVACAPGMGVEGAGYQRTGDVRAVTCRLCKETVAFTALRRLTR